MNNDLMRVLDYAYNNSPYYHNKLPNLTNSSYLTEEEFASFPVLDRKMLIDEFESIIDINYQFLRRKELHLIRTSGSTGKIVNVLWHPIEYIHSNTCLWRYRKNWYGISPNDKQCSFVSGTQIGSTLTSSNSSHVTKTKNRLDLSVICFDEKSLFNYYNQIRDFQPDWIYGAPSAILMYVEFCLKYNLNKIKSIKYVELATEQVLASSYNYLRKYFEVPVAIMYGAKEVNAIAITNPQDEKMYVIKDNVFVETTEKKEILVTSLKNKVFPIIRYNLGDIIEMLRNEFDDCIINVIKGRTRHLSFVDEETGITVAALTNALFTANSRLGDPFLQYKIHEEQKIFSLIIYIKNEFKNWGKSIENEIINCCKNFNIETNRIRVIISDVPLDVENSTGKLKLFNH